MKTIKIIDLLNKIANGEEVPKEIKVNDNIYHYDETDCNEFYRYRTMTNELLTDYADLNDEVEILEEDNRIEKIEKKYKDDYRYVINDFNEKIRLSDEGNFIIDKINAIIDYLESKEKGE